MKKVAIIGAGISDYILPIYLKEIPIIKLQSTKKTLQLLLMRVMAFNYL